MNKQEATAITGGLTQTSKMPCKSFSTPTLACVTGYKLAQVPGTVCSDCYAQKGFYRAYANTIEPAQHARLDALLNEDAYTWERAMATLIGNDPYFRWFDSGDIPSVEALHKIMLVCVLTPATKHWLVTREYAMVKQYLKKHPVASNVTVRLSAAYPDKPMRLEKALQVPGITVANVHFAKPPVGHRCPAPTQGGKCGSCRACWDRDVPAVSYHQH